VPAPSLIEHLPIANVWSGHPVHFALVTHGDRQLAAFYDAERQLTVALRTLGDRSWQFAALPSTLGWDSHNHIAMAVDDVGHVHVAGNMHDVPLIYFRTSAPLDITSFRRVLAMVGKHEQSCACPEFFRGPTGALVFAYRDGGRPRSTTAGMAVRWQSSFGAPKPGSGTEYMLRWETLESNRDLPRAVVPAATPLELFAFRRPTPDRG
jgi:hypothetical protein